MDQVALEVEDTSLMDISGGTELRCSVPPVLGPYVLGILQSHHGGIETTMERVLNLHIEKLPEGVYLATSDEIQGLVAQGRTITETIEIARDVAKKLLEARSERDEASATQPPDFAS